MTIDYLAIYVAALSLGATPEEADSVLDLLHDTAPEDISLNKADTVHVLLDLVRDKEYNE